MNNLVSVIIPTFGNNDLLKRAISSVLSQSYAPIEVIVVDDNGAGSINHIKNDGVLRDFLSSQVKYVVHENNRGGSAARNTGAKNASGAYLCFLDDDDFFSDKDKVFKQISCQKNLDDTWGGTYSSMNKYYGETFIRHIEAKYSGKILKEYIIGKTSIGTASPIIRKDYFDLIGGFDETFKRHQDWEFLCRFLDKFKMHAVPDAYYNRCYKINVKKKSLAEKLELLDYFTSRIKDKITSLPPSKLDRLLKKKYEPIVLNLFSHFKLRDAYNIASRNHFSALEYLDMFLFLFQYIFYRLVYGQRF